MDIFLFMETWYFSCLTYLVCLKSYSPIYNLYALFQPPRSIVEVFWIHFRPPRTAITGGQSSEVACGNSGSTRDMVLKVEIITSDVRFLRYKVTFTPLTKASARILHEDGDYQLNIVDSHDRQSEILEFQAIPKLLEVGTSDTLFLRGNTGFLRINVEANGTCVGYCVIQVNSSKLTTSGYEHLLSNLRDLKLLYDKESKFAEQHDTDLNKPRPHGIPRLRRLLAEIKSRHFVLALNEINRSPRSWIIQVEEERLVERCKFSTASSVQLLFRVRGKSIRLMPIYTCLQN
jgi:hypothetical protein